MPNTELIEIIARAICDCDPDLIGPFWTDEGFKVPVGVKILEYYKGDVERVLQAIEAAGYVVVPAPKGSTIKVIHPKKETK